MILKEKQKKLYSLSLVYQLGISLIVPLLIGILGGIWLDNQFKTSPIFVLIGLFLGIMIAGYSLYYELLPFLKRNTPKHEK